MTLPARVHAAWWVHGGCLGTCRMVGAANPSAHTFLSLEKRPSLFYPPHPSLPFSRFASNFVKVRFVRVSRISPSRHPAGRRRTRAVRPPHGRRHPSMCARAPTGVVPVHVHVNRQRTFSPAKPYEKHPRDVLPPQTIRDSTPVPSSRPLHVLAADMNGYEAERLRRPASPPHVHEHRVAVVPRARHLDRLEQLVLFTRLVAGVPGGCKWTKKKLNFGWGS